jgi:hypothetical protein
MILNKINFKKNAIYAFLKYKTRNEIRRVNIVFDESHKKRKRHKT